MENKRIGECFCGAVRFEVTGAPAFMGYCHCTSCRSWSGGPVNAYTLWKPEQVKITKGLDFIGKFNKTTKSDRQFCTQCGGLLMTYHALYGFMDVYAAKLPDLPFVPGAHLHYAETVLKMKDGLRKFKDMPAEYGGSGQMLPE